MTLKTYERTPHVTQVRTWTDDDSTDFELPHEVTQEIASLTSAVLARPRASCRRARIARTIASTDVAHPLR